MTRVKNKFSKGLAIFLSAALIFTTAPYCGFKAKADTYDLTVTVVSGGYGRDGNNDILISKDGTYTIEGSSTAENIIVSNCKANITLDNVSIDVSGRNKGAFLMTSNASVNLTLSGSNTLKSGTNYAGIDVSDGTSLTVTGTKSDSLIANGGICSAGIGSGGNNSDACGSVTINGGNVTANGGNGVTQNSGGAGIGGGCSWNSDGGTIKINGGTVLAYGNGYGAGIGGGTGTTNNGGNITITGGNVTAYGDADAAGIGSAEGGQHCSGGNITITGGIVNAVSGDGEGAGIGGAFDDAEGTVKISGGTVTASGADYYDIGSGMQYSGSVCQTTITGGSVNARIKAATNGSASIYKTALSLRSGSSVQSLSVKQNGADLSYGSQDMQADGSSNGKLYLWLPANATTANVTTESGSYSGYCGTVDTSNSSVLKMNQSALSVNMNSEYTIGDAIPVSTTGGSGNGGVTYDYKSSSGTDYGAVQPTAIGSYTVTATKAGDDCYYPATSAQQSFDIIPDTPTVTSVFPSGGTAGTSVTITGMNLAGASAVEFGGNFAAGYTINSGTSITATAPAGSGTVDITVTTPNGTSTVSAADQFTYFSSDATLSGLAISPGALNETFYQNTFSYTANAGRDVSEVTVTPTVNESHATFKVNGSSPAQGQTGVAVALSSDDITTKIPIEVTAQSGASQTYYITVTKSDTAKPVLDIDSNGYQNGVWTNKDVTLGVSNTTQNLGTTTFEYSTDGINWLPYPGGMITDSTEGVTTYSFRATSESGVQSDVSSITAKIDKTAPETHKITIADNDFTTFLNTITFGMFFNDTQTATITAADSGSGVASVQYQLVHDQSDYNEDGTWTDYPDGGISLNPDDKYIVYAQITDNAGNYIIVNSNGVIVDKTSPELSLSAPSGWQTSSTLSVGVTATDNLAGIKSVSYTTDEATPQTGTVNLANGSGSIMLTDEGDYNLTVMATDNAGNKISQTAHIQWDKEAPTITVSGNPESPVQTATLTVNATAGASGIKSVTVSGPQGDKDITGTYTNGYTVAQNGTYTFTEKNNAGVAVSSTPVVVTNIDTAKPGVNINSYGYQNGVWTNKDVTLGVSNTTQNLGTTTFEYSTDGIDWLPLTGGSITDSTEGVTTYSFRATSESGVQSDVSSITAKIDKTAPETHKITIADNDFTTFLNTITFGMFFNETQTATITAADSGSGVASVQYQLVHDQSDYNEDGTWTDYPDGGISLNPDDKYIVYAEITDNAGNYIIVNSNGVIVDKTSPELSLSAPSGWQTSSTLSVGVTATDNLAGIKSVSYTTDEATPQTGTVNLTNGSGSIMLTDEGDYNLTVTATDNAGNKISQTAHVQWDKEAPTITVSGNPESPVQTATLTVNATAGASGIKSVTVSGPQGDKDITGTYTNGYTVAQNGTYTFTVTNYAGVAVSSTPVVVTNIDTAKPVINVNSNGYQNGVWTNKDVTLGVSNTTQNLGTTTFEYSTDGTNWLPLTGGSITDSTEGVTTYSFRATSESGVQSDVSSFTAKIDKTAPTGMAVSFKQNPFKTVANFATFGVFFGATVDVNFSADDSLSGVNRCEYQIVGDGGTFDANGAWQTGSLSISPDFKGTVYARAVDNAGNVSGYVTKSFVVDKTVPVITANSGNPTLITLNPNASIPVEVKDDGAGVGTVTYQINGGEVKTLDLTADSYKDPTGDCTFSIGSLPDGIYDVTVNAQDNSGNAAATATVHVLKNAAQSGFGFSSGTVSKTYGDDPFTVTAAGGQSGGDVTYSVTGGTDVLSVDAATGKATIQKAGTAVITAVKAAGNGYSAATAELTVNVAKAEPTIKTLPEASEISVIGKLSVSSLTGGKASVPGTFDFTNPDTVVTKSGTYDVTFTPNDSVDYNTVDCNAAVTVTPFLTGGGSNAQLDFTGVALPAGVTSVSLGSAVQSSGSSTCSVVEKLVGNNKSLGSLSALTVYDLKLLDQNGNPVENFTGKIKVKIPIPAGMSGNLKVLWYNPTDGTLTDMGATQENGYLVFETSHFSCYAIAQLKFIAGTKSPSGTTDSTVPVPNPNTGSGSWPSVPLALLGGSSAFGTAAMKRRRFFKKKK